MDRRGDASSASNQKGKKNASEIPRLGGMGGVPEPLAFAILEEGIPDEKEVRNLFSQGSIALACVQQWRHPRQPCWAGRDILCRPLIGTCNFVHLLKCKHCAKPITTTGPDGLSETDDSEVDDPAPPTGRECEGDDTFLKRK